MTDASSFAKLVPGFDFLKDLVKNAGTLPNMGQWVAPTLNPEELTKRIEELKTVQFWLEQNARMLSATIQALEVQRMTLSTLKTMNVQMGDLRDSLTARPVPTPSPQPEADVSGSAQATAPSRPASSKKNAQAAASDPSAGMVDPMQWWGALTQQFTQLATTAMKEGAADAALSMANAMMKPVTEAPASAGGSARRGAPRSPARKTTTRQRAAKTAKPKTS